MPSSFHIILKEDIPDDAPQASNGHCVGGRLVDASHFGTLRLTLDVTAADGDTPTLDVDVEHAPAPGGPWSVLGSFTQATAPGSEAKVFGPCHRYVRPSCQLGGTGPSFRFAIAGEGV